MSRYGDPIVATGALLTAKVIEELVWTDSGLLSYPKTHPGETGNYTKVFHQSWGWQTRTLDTESRDIATIPC